VTAIGITLGGFVTLATGISLVYLLMGIPGRGSKSRVLTTVCLGLAVGVVLTSCGHFFWQEVLSRTPSTFLLVDVGLLLVVASALRLRSTRRSVVDPSAGTVGPTQRIVAVPLLSAASLAAVFAGAAFVLHQLTGREGAWDAVSIWNLKAHFLLRAGPYWSDAIDPALLQSHPDYPLLLPLTIARIWRYAGGIDSTFVPIAAAAIFTTASVVLLGASVALVRGRAQGWLAALALLAMPFFFEVGAWQYADVPLAFFELATIVCATLAYRQEETDGAADDRARGAWTVAGLCAGGALWTKNEGALFVAAFLAAVVAVDLLRRDHMRARTRLGKIGMGLLPAVITLIAFRLKHPFPNDIVASLDHRTLGRMLDPSRHATVFNHLQREASSSPDRLPTFFVFAYAAVAAAQTHRIGSSLRSSERTALAASALCLVLLSAALYSTYLITPYPVDWQITRSAHRLWLQLLPSVLFVIFVALPPAESVLGARQR